MSRSITAYLYGLLLVPLLVAASEHRPEKAAWELTLEERLAKRFDPENVKGRAELKAQEQHSAGVAVTGGDSIDGAREPELLMPSEVFQSLFTQGFDPIPESRDIFREDIEKRAADLGLRPSFWHSLEAVASEYLSMMLEQRALIREYNDTTAERRREIDVRIASFRLPFCRSRAEALAAAREHFGAEWFDRFLYVAVAPGIDISFIGGAEDTPARHRFLEGGCR